MNERIFHLRAQMMSLQEVIITHHFLNDLAVSAVGSLLEGLGAEGLEACEHLEMMTAEVSKTALDLR